MSDLEELLRRLRPAKAPERIWEDARRGRAPTPARPWKEMIFLTAAAAGLLASLVYILRAPSNDPVAAAPGDPEELRKELKTYRHKIIFETNRDGNWELYLVNADGSDPVNLTRTPDVDEIYPKASPDGTMICFLADEGQGEGKSRNLYHMKGDGTGRVKAADNAREPCWSPDGRKIAYLPGELAKHTYSDFATKGLRVYDLESRSARAHTNTKLHHLYTLGWSADGKWFVATVHGGMGFKHGILAIEAEGEGVYDLKLGGCRPDLHPDGKRIAWGHGDYAVGVADLEWGPPPRAANVRDAVVSADPLETYHADWSPDGRYIAYSYGPKFKKKNLKGLLPEFPGVDAPEWNLCVADASKKNTWIQITTDGKSNKEPDWVRVEEK